MDKKEIWGGVGWGGCERLGVRPWTVQVGMGRTRGTQAYLDMARACEYVEGFSIESNSIGHRKDPTDRGPIGV